MERTPSKIWMDGKIVSWKNAKVHVLTHALHYGTAIFEGMRCYNTKNGPAVFRMDDHYKRMVGGAKAYRFVIDYSINELKEATTEIVRRNKLKDCYLRPICYAGYKGIGLDISDAPFEFAIIPFRMGKFFGKKAQTGLSCEVSSWKRVSSSILSPHVKASANYLNSALAKLEAKNAGYDEAIMLSEDGKVSEASSENIFVIKNRKIITPPLSDGVLAGVTRDSIIEMANEIGYKVSEESLLRDDLYTADEVFLCGTAAEITPVRSVDKRNLTNGPGPITKELQETFENITKGKDGRFEKWLNYVN
ncbi:MAG: branched-chain amino acid transaminase [Candidatus Bilamarchaeum sp.]|jgi:branched-chain amino acid aminotransferase